MREEADDDGRRNYLFSIQHPAVLLLPHPEKVSQEENSNNDLPRYLLGFQFLRI